MRYLVRVTGVEPKFEEVTEAVFRDRKHAINDNGEQRYNSDEYAVVDGSRIVELQISNLNGAAFGMLLRHIGASVPTGLIQSDFCRKPDAIRLRKRGVTTLTNAAGEVFVLKMPTTMRKAA